MMANGTEIATYALSSGRYPETHDSGEVSLRVGLDRASTPTAWATAHNQLAGSKPFTTADRLLAEMGPAGDQLVARGTIC